MIKFILFTTLINSAWGTGFPLYQSEEPDDYGLLHEDNLREYQKPIYQTQVMVDYNDEHTGQDLIAEDEPEAKYIPEVKYEQKSIEAISQQPEGSSDYQRPDAKQPTYKGYGISHEYKHQKKSYHTTKVSQEKVELKSVNSNYGSHLPDPPKPYAQEGHRVPTKSVKNDDYPTRIEQTHVAHSPTPKITQKRLPDYKPNNADHQHRIDDDYKHHIPSIKAKDTDYPQQISHEAGKGLYGNSGGYKGYSNYRIKDLDYKTAMLGSFLNNEGYQSVPGYHGSLSPHSPNHGYSGISSTPASRNKLAYGSEYKLGLNHHRGLSANSFSPNYKLGHHSSPLNTGSVYQSLGSGLKYPSGGINIGPSYGTSGYTHLPNSLGGSGSEFSGIGGIHNTKYSTPIYSTTGSAFKATGPSSYPPFQHNGHSLYRGALNNGDSRHLHLLGTHATTPNSGFSYGNIHAGTNLGAVHAGHLGSSSGRNYPQIGSISPYPGKESVNLHLNPDYKSIGNADYSGYNTYKGSDLGLPHHNLDNAEENKQARIHQTSDDHKYISNSGQDHEFSGNEKSQHPASRYPGIGESQGEPDIPKYEEKKTENPYAGSRSGPIFQGHKLENPSYSKYPLKSHGTSSENSEQSNVYKSDEPVSYRSRPNISKEEPTSYSLSGYLSSGRSDSPSSSSSGSYYPKRAPNAHNSDANYKSHAAGVGSSGSPDYHGNVGGTDFNLGIGEKGSLGGPSSLDAPKHYSIQNKAPSSSEGVKGGSHKINDETPKYKGIGESKYPSQTKIEGVKGGHSSGVSPSSVKGHSVKGGSGNSGVKGNSPGKSSGYSAVKSENKYLPITAVHSGSRRGGIQRSPPPRIQSKTSGATKGYEAPKLEQVKVNSESSGVKGGPGSQNEGYSAQKSQDKYLPITAVHSGSSRSPPRRAQPIASKPYKDDEDPKLEQKELVYEAFLSGQGAPNQGRATGGYGFSRNNRGSRLPSYGSDEKHEDSPPMPYEFQYEVKDDEHGSEHYRREKMDDNGQLTGAYGYKDAHGLYRQVEYEASKDGFKVSSIKTNEPGTDNQDPADVHFEVEKSNQRY